MPDVVRLVLDGRDFAGWKAVTITRSIEAGAGGFELSLTERAPDAPELRVIRPGARCELAIDADVLITGHVDEVAVSIDRGSHGITVRGRDAVGDLIDCAPDLDPAQWVNVGLLKLASDLVKPFGIAVRAEVPLGVNFSEVALNGGATIWSVIEAHARYRQVLAISDGKGGLLFTRAGTRRLATTILEGANLRTGSATYSWAERHSVYVVKGQSFDTGDEGAEAGRPSSGPIRDREVTRHRPLLIVASNAVDDQKCIDRARWEALTRAARGARAEVTVAGWRDAGGALWALNALVPLRSPTLGLDGEFLISQVVFSLSSAGTETSLTLVRPDAFAVSPEREPEPLELGFSSAEGSEE